MVLNVQSQKVIVMLKTFLSFLVLMLGTLCIAQDKAIPTELVQYIRDARKAGLKDSQIQQNAIKAGWPAATVGEAIASPSGDGKAAADGKPASNAPSPATSEGASTPATGPVAATWEPAGNPAPLVPMPRPDAGTNTTGTNPTGAGPEGVKTPSSNALSDDYRIGEGDVLQISVLGEQSASVPSVVVRTDGKITMPLIKEIVVAGLTPSEVEKTVTEQLSKMIRAPDVTVIVAQSNSQKIFMIGAVKKEGPLHYTYRMSVMQAISEAGGLTDYAKKKRIYVIRNQSGRQFQFPFDYEAVMKGQHMEMNRILEPGDTVVVPH
jgi:polysaccharide biosynthesis/export protein